MKRQGYTRKHTIKEGIDDKEIVYMEFLIHLKEFLKQLLTEPTTAKIDDFLMGAGLSNEQLLKCLMDRSIILRSETVDDNCNNGVLKIKYQIPRKNFDKKIHRLYSQLFECDNMIKEDGGDGGACSAANSGVVVGPIGSPIRRIFITQAQAKQLEETTTFSVGNYTYDAPVQFVDVNEKKDPAYKRDKIKGISIEIRK